MPEQRKTPLGQMRIGVLIAVVFLYASGYSSLF